MVNTSFSQEQFDSIYPEGIENHYWNHARNRIIGKLLGKNKLTRGKLLEIGCGKGVVVNFIRDQGINCYGVELGKVIPLSKVTDFVFASTDAFDLPEDFRDSIDTILILDVIEHLEDPDAFISSILESYKNLENIVITVPARMELWTNYDTYNHHFRRYILSDIRLLENELLSVRQARYFNHLLYPVFLIFARLVRTRKTVIRAPHGMGILIHRFLSFLLQMDQVLLPGKLAGTSIIALLKVHRP